jgi:predicted O-linked N-acetylglucosamine transferase (SPINDLY family)
MDANSIFQSALRCHQAGDLLQAENLYRETIQYNPYHADAYYNLGIILQSRAGIHGAISCYETAVQLNPDLTDAYYNLGIAYAKIFEYKKASAYYMEAIKKNPSDFEAFSNLAGILCEQGKWNESEACFRKALEIYPSSPNIYSALLMAMNFNPQNTPEKILLEHRKFAGSFSKSAHPAGYSNNLKSSRKLRIGYISPDFRNHSVAFFISPVIKAHDRKQFEIFCYADVFTGDEVTKSIQNSTDHWVVTIGMPDETVIELIREHEIDILIDLAGHAVNNRMSVFAGNPAPVQISWIGYPATTGLP